MGMLGRVCACIAIGAGLLLSVLAVQSPAAAQSALLDVLSPHVMLSRAGVVVEIADERVIHSGDTVATDVAGRAVATYPDGSTATLEESSELTIEFERTSAGDSLVRMQQSLGRVWYAVTQTVASSSRYEVRSAAMASVIRAGSGSYVAVAASGETTVVAIEGSVETSAGGESVTVPAGSATTVAGTGAGAAALAVAPAPVLPPPPTLAPRANAVALPAPQTKAPATPQTATGAPSPTPTKKPARTPAPTASPKNAFEPPLATLPTLPFTTAAPLARSTSRPAAAVTTSPMAAPAPSRATDKLVLRTKAPATPTPARKSSDKGKDKDGDDRKEHDDD